MPGAGDIEQLDAALASQAREGGALRVRLGQLLEVLGRGAVFELGFSSLGAYAVERCERSVRWAEEARCLARRVEALPKLRQAMALGQVSWSMGTLLARIAAPEDESRWLEQARSRTVRQMRRLVMQTMLAARQGSGKGALGSTAAGSAAEPGGNACDSCWSGGGARSAEEFGVPDQDDELGSLHSDTGAQICTLTCTVDREDAWLFEATRYLLDHLGVRGVVEQCDALLAEAQGTLLAERPEAAAELDGSDRLRECDEARRRWEGRLRSWREHAEALCEKEVLGELLSARAAGPKPAEYSRGVASECGLGIGPLEHASCTQLDRQVRAVAGALARHEIELSRLALRFHRADGWRRLGYATEAQYARERLGVSRSSLRARRALALQLDALPAVAAALAAGQIGVEAAVQLARIATPSTEGAWVERAMRRTIKHLREEVAAASMAVRWAREGGCLPPEDAELVAFQTLEQTVVSGRFGVPRDAADASGTPASGSGGPAFASRLGHLSEPQCDARRCWYRMLASLSSWLDEGLQMSAAGLKASAPMASRPRSSAARVALRLRMSREAYEWWRELEAQARRWLPAGVSWLRFLCLCVWRAWRHLLGADVAYGHIFIRDRFRCLSPVCNRRDVTPHHLHFRSAGGGDEDRNIGSICTWCHLCGLHGGRIRAQGSAQHIRWELGPKGSPCLIVDGRERCAA